MGAVAKIVAFGVGLFAGGLFWKLGEDILTSYFVQYIYNTTDPYYLASNLIWQMIPYALIFVGVLCLILAGFLDTATRSVVYE
jgi:hypothetical protein